MSHQCWKQRFPSSGVRQLNGSPPTCDRLCKLERERLSTEIANNYCNAFCLPDYHFYMVNTITEGFFVWNCVRNTSRFICYLSTQVDPITGTSAVVHHVNIDFFAYDFKIWTQTNWQNSCEKAKRFRALPVRVITSYDPYMNLAIKVWGAPSLTITSFARWFAPIFYKQIKSTWINQGVSTRM